MSEEEAVDPKLKELEEKLAAIPADESQPRAIEEPEETPAPAQEDEPTPVEADGEPEGESEIAPQKEGDEAPAKESSLDDMLATGNDETEDEGLPKVEEGQSPTPDNWKQTREYVKGLKAQLKETKAELDAAKQTPAPVPQDNRQPSQDTGAPASPEDGVMQARKQLGDDNIFSIAAKAKEFGFEDHNNEQVLAEAKTAISTMSVDDLAKVKASFDSGKIEGRSDTLSDLINGAMTDALIRERNQTVENQRLEQEAIAKREASLKSYDVAKERVPELNDLSNPVTQKVKELFAEKVAVIDRNGRIVKPGPYAEHLNSPNWPELIYPVLAAEARSLLSESSSDKKVEALKKEVSDYIAPRAVNGNRQPEGETPVSRMQELKQHLAGVKV